jgi:16S rRNA (cytosine967-C5)-methyltransferase
LADPKHQSARKIAAEVLNQLDPRRSYAGPILNRLLSETDQRQRATDLVFGTLRNRTAIDTVIEAFSGRQSDQPEGLDLIKTGFAGLHGIKPASGGVERISKRILSVIRVAVFELVYSPQTPDYSIVNEAVENTKTIGGKRQIAFANAVLRQIARHITNRSAELEAAIPWRTLPQNQKSGCEFDTDFLPDPQTSPLEYLSNCFSLPKWLVENWLNEYGNQTTQQICFASNRRPSIYLRPNILKTTTQELLKKLHTANIDAEVVPDLEMIKIKSPKTVTELPGFSEGLFSVQDITAYQVIRILNPQQSWTILDLCAAPGTKTTLLAEQTGDKAEIVATDIDAERLKMLKENITRLGVNSVTILEYEKLFKNSQFSPDEVGLDQSRPRRNSKFDAVLLDAPCSNTGVLARRVEARYRITPNMIKQLAKIQRKLLGTAAEIIKKGGKICYSTCSIQRQENNKMIKDFLSDNNRFELEYEKLILPSAEGFDCDGGYITILTNKRKVNPMKSGGQARHSA